MLKGKSDEEMRNKAVALAIQIKEEIIDYSDKKHEEISSQITKEQFDLKHFVAAAIMLGQAKGFCSRYICGGYNYTDVTECIENAGYIDQEGNCYNFSATIIRFGRKIHLEALHPEKKWLYKNICQSITS